MFEYGCFQCYVSLYITAILECKNKMEKMQVTIPRYPARRIGGTHETQGDSHPALRACRVPVNT